jgi:hypothetical protein
VDTKNKINEQMNWLTEHPSPANFTKGVNLAYYGFHADMTKTTMQNTTHNLFHRLVNRYMNTLNGTLKELVEAFPAGQEQVQFLRQVAAFRPGSNPSEIDQSPRELPAPQPKNHVDVDKTALSSIPEANETLLRDEEYLEPKPAIGSPEKTRAADALISLQAVTPSVTEKKQPKRRRSCDLGRYPKRINAHSHTRPVVTSPQKKRAASVLLTLLKGNNDS